VQSLDAWVTHHDLDFIMNPAAEPLARYALELRTRLALHAPERQGDLRTRRQGDHVKQIKLRVAFLRKFGRRSYCAKRV
jgi:hypothetical protein